MSKGVVKVGDDPLVISGDIEEKKNDRGKNTPLSVADQVGSEPRQWAG